MGKWIRQYRELSFEQKTIRKTVIGLCFSAVLACGKLMIGLFTDYNLISIAVCTFGVLLAKLECVLGARADRPSFEKRNLLTAVFLFLSGVFYIGFMSRMFFIERRIKNNGLIPVVLLAFISFCELGFAIAGLIRTKNKGHFYRNIKIINFCVALIAILTTQMSILNMQSETGVVSIANAYSGIGIGIFIVLCAGYILIAPKTSVIDREHHKFVLRDARRNRLIGMKGGTVELLLCRSVIYGDFLFRAKIGSDTVEGDIVRGKSLWKRMHILCKILCCVLSEILLIVWLIGRGILFLRSLDLPRRLENRMRENGFEPVPADP